MKTLKDMTNLKKETFKFLKKYYKQLDKLEEALGEEKTMRHTPTESEEKAWEQYRKFLRKQEKFILADFITLLEVGKTQPEDFVKKFKELKQVRIESHSFKQILKDIMAFEGVRDALDKALEEASEHNFTV